MSVHERDVTHIQGRPHDFIQRVKASKRGRRRDRGNEGVEGRGMGRGIPSRLGSLRSVVSCPGGVRGGAPAENDFGAF